MEIKQKQIKTLIPSEYNPRQLTQAQHEHLKASLKRFGAVDPAIINSNEDRKNIIIGGHQRIKIAKELGWETFPCVEVELNRDKERELNIRLNKNTGGWDWDGLANDFDVEELTDWGFSDEELFGDGVFEQGAEEDNFDVPDEDEIETEIQGGRLIEIGRHRLLCGDATDMQTLENLMEGRSANMVITDPPYNVDYTGKTKDALTIENDKMDDADFYSFLLEMYKNVYNVTKKGASWYVFHADSEGHNFRRAFIEAGLKLSQCLVWNKNSMVMGRQDYHWKHEPILYGWKEGKGHSWYADRKQTTVLNFDRPNRNAEHPTMKPIALISYLIGNSSKKENCILDPFLGSGSTMVAAHQLDRTCYGMEIDPKHCQVIVDRMLKLDPALNVKFNGESYEENEGS